MTARPTLVILALAVTGASALLFAGPHVLPSVYVTAAFGALWAGVAVAWLLRELRPRDRFSIAAGAGVLGFLVGSVAGVGPFPASLSFAASFLPSLVLFIAGIGRERQAFELARLEEAIDDPAARPRAAARAAAIRDETRAAAREIDPDARTAPAHAGDPRGVYAYAAEVLAYAHAQDGAYAPAVEALAEVPLRWMPAGMQPLMIGNLAFCHLCLGDAKAALDALDRLAEKDVAPEHRAVLRASRALALLRQDRADEALGIVGKTDEESLPPERMKPRYAVVRALALAASGDRAGAAAALASPEARAELARLRPAAPPGAIAVVDEVLAARPA